MIGGWLRGSSRILVKMISNFSNLVMSVLACFADVGIMYGMSIIGDWLFELVEIWIKVWIVLTDL